ncbi:hypothetical protein PCASD_11517 [Puccinia coronata f. sp. avenae]|uniref:Thioredoxin domain-containing protein n=1 Tax=Puccinia coronata f. sp. avenae TaxID=200324 RepID=A0A2N5ULQ2_9BASI|nr:hypothetical protein PCASD_11517 [Puccinia coronata f. sp. avenae]
MKLLNPLFHLILTLSSAALATEFHAGEQLNENNFQALTKEGLVLIELYSPFCAVCKRFAPSWIELVEKMTPYQSKGLSMAQVDCSAQGDLCAQLGVNSYPTLKLYRDGKDAGNYDDDKNVESIQTYLEQKVEEYQSSSKTDHNAPRYTEPQHSEPSPETYASDEPVPQASPPPDSEDPTLQPIPDTPVDTPVELPNPFGQVISLNSHNWNSYTDSAKNAFPIFVHFHTAWCKECRRLSHVWQNVARLLQNQVNVGEIDCEAKWNKKICKNEHVVQFPTFLIYHDGTKLSYSGPKLASSMAEDILKTVATPGTHEITMREFDRAIEEKNIFFLFLHSSRTPVSIINSVQTVGKGLLGSAVILKSDHQDIYDRLGLSNYYPYLLVFKEYQAEPWAKIKLEEISSKEESNPTLRHRKLTAEVRRWIAVNSIPVLDELDQRNYHRILNSGTKKLVVLACISGIIPSHDGINLDKSNPRSVQLKDEMKLWALQWRKSQAARGVDDLMVDWVWVNSDVWSEWLYTAYRVNLPRPTEDPRESSMILIVNTKQHRYFDTQANGRDIEFTSSSVFQTLLAVEMGKLSGKMSGTFKTRMIWRYERFKAYFGFLFQPHWLLFWVVLIGIVGFSVKNYRQSIARGAAGYGPVSPQSAKVFSSSLLPDSLSSKSPMSSRSPGFGSVFGLASNVPCKSD